MKIWRQVELCEEDEATGAQEQGVAEAGQP